MLAAFDDTAPEAAAVARALVAAARCGRRRHQRRAGRTTGRGSRSSALDRVGLLADIAGVFALQRASVRAARAWADGEHAVSVWDVADELVDPAVLRQRFDAVADGRVDPTARLARGQSGSLAPSVVIRPEASRRRHGARGPGRRPAGGAPPGARRAGRGSTITVRSAHVDTLGPQAVDVFYLQEASAGALSEHRGRRGRPRRTREALTAADGRLIGRPGG